MKNEGASLEAPPITTYFLQTKLLRGVLHRIRSLFNKNGLKYSG